MANALKKITARAKQLDKKGGTWRGAIKKAGAEYRSGKKVGSVRKSKRKASPRKRRRAVSSVSHTAVSGGVTGSIGSAKTFIRGKLKDQLSALLLQQALTKGKMKRRALAKKIAKKKSELKNYT